MDTIEPAEENALLGEDAVEDDEFDYKGEDDYLDQLDEELFDDPIKILKWIKKHARS